MATIQSILAARVRKALADAGFDESAAAVSASSDTRFGDYQSNSAMVLAKSAKMPPRKVAEQILEKLDVSGISAAPEIAGAGFLNFRILPEFFSKQLRAMADDERLGVPVPERAKTFVVDFSSPNVAKPMHVGHIRSTILGDALSRIASFAGHRVIRDNHIGDWGTQFGMLLLGWKTLLDRTALEADPIGEMERLYKTVNAGGDEVRDKARAELVKLQAGDEENLAIWKEMIRLSQAQFETVYRRLDISFDVTLGESFYNPWLAEVVDDLVAKGIARESEGALCIFSDGSVPPKEDPFLISRDGEWVDIPAIVRKDDGAYNYSTTDLATLQYRMSEWAPDEILYVTDGRQQLHFRQIFSAFRRWKGNPPVRLAHVWFGSILGDDGKPFKTRSGDTVKLVDLLDEAEERALKAVTEKNPDMEESARREIARAVGLGSIKYSDLLPNRQSDYVFSWDKMLSFQGNTAPYLQYSAVRVRSIFRKLDAEFVMPAELSISEPAEFALGRKLLQFGEVLPQVLDEFRPNLLANYLYELAGLFHSFFEACPVLKSEGAMRESRLALCELTGRTLKTGLGLLGIESPERM